MAREFIVDAEVALGYMSFNNLQNSKPILLNSKDIANMDVNTKLTDFFSLPITAQSDTVSVKGIFVISTGEDRICASDEALSVGVEIYRDFYRSKLVYSNYSVIAGVEQNGGPKIEWSIPVKFEDVAMFSSTEEIANYFVTIVVNQSNGSINPNLELVQYSLIGMKN